MPRWLKGVLIALVATLFVLVLIAYLFAAGMRAMFDTFTGGVLNEETAEDTGGETEVYFLQTPGFDAGAPGAAIILHPALTGLPEPVAVTDPDLIQAAAQTAFFTDNRRAEGRMVLLSILFLSPPGNGTRATMATLFQNGEEVATLTCFTGRCPRNGPPTAPYDLAGLDTGAQAVRYELETITGTDAARAFEADLRARPDHFVARGLSGLPEPAQRFDGYVWLELPSTFGPWDENTSYTGGAELAAMNTALADWRLSLPFEVAIDLNSTRGQWTQYQILDAETGRQATGADGYLASDGYLPHFQPEARIWVDAANADAVRESLATADWPVPTPPPSDAVLTARLADALQANGLSGDATRYSHTAEIYDLRESLRVTGFTEPEVLFGYYMVQE